MTYEADTIGKRSHRTGYYLALDGVPTRFATHRFDQMVMPTSDTAHAWWKLDEDGGSTAFSSVGLYNLTVTGTVPGAPSFLQPTTATTGSRYFTDDLGYFYVNNATLASSVAEQASVSAGFRTDNIINSEYIFEYSGLTSSELEAENAIIGVVKVGTEIALRWETGAGTDVINITSGAGIAAGVAYHVMVTWQKNGATTDATVYLWRVGSGLVHEEKFTGLTTATGGDNADFTIGSSRTSNTPPSPGTWDGYIEDVVLWKIHHSRDKALAYLSLASAPFEPALDVASIGASGSSLDRSRSLIIPGGFSARVMDGEVQREVLSRRDGTTDTLLLAVNPSIKILETESSDNDSGRVVYLERETILLGTIDGDDYLLCERGAWGSSAGTHGAGMVISSRPRHLMGRRGTLWAVDLDTLNSQVLRAGILSSSPQFSEGAYDLDFVDVQKELNRPLMRGFLPQKSADYNVNANFTFNVEVDDASNFVDGTRSQIKVSADDFYAVYNAPSGTVNTATNAVNSLSANNLLFKDVGPSVDKEVQNTGTFPDIELELRQVQVITQDPAIAALQLMCSILGDGANGTYDVLPGRAPSATSPIRMVGAGIPADWIDITAWEALEGVGGVCRFYIEEETRLLDFLVEEIAWRLGGYVYVTAEGKISFQRYRAIAPNTDASTLSKSSILGGAVSVVDDEADTVGRVSINCNYDYVEREYMAKHQVVFADLNGTYGDDLASIELESKSMWIGGGGSALNSPPSSQWEIISSFDRIYSRTKDGVRKLKFRLPWNLHTTYIPGHAFRLSDDRLPDFSGGVGITSRAHEVTSSTPDTQTGTVEVEAEEMPPGYLIAPAAVVVSSSIGPDTLTLDTTTDYHGTEPGLDFIVGASILLFDADASPPFSASDPLYVTAVTGSTIEVGGFGTITPAVGDIVVMEYDLFPPNTSPATGAAVEDHLYHGDTTSKLA